MRRLLQPELLEGRHAPSGVIPFEVMTALVADDRIGNWVADESQQTDLRGTYRRGIGSMAPEWHAPLEDFTVALRASDLEAEQSGQYAGAARQTAEARTPAEMAAFNSAFESLGSGILTWVGELIPPPVIQPVEPPELQPQPAPGTQPDEPLLSLPADGVNDEAPMSHPIENVPESGVSSPAPQTPNEAVNPGVELPPMLIQPVIMDPESEHNQPSPPADDTPTGA